MIIAIIIIIGIMVETILIGSILIALKKIDNDQECDKQFWEDKECSSCGVKKGQ